MALFILQFPISFSVHLFHMFMIDVLKLSVTWPLCFGYSKTVVFKIFIAVEHFWLNLISLELL